MTPRLEMQLWDFMPELDESTQDYLLNFFHNKILTPDMLLKDAMNVIDNCDDYHYALFEKILEQLSVDRKLDDALVIKLGDNPIKHSGGEWRGLIAYKEEEKTKSYDDMGIPIENLKRICCDDELNELEYALAKLFCGWFSDIGLIQRKLWTLINAPSMISSPDGQRAQNAQLNSKAQATKSLELINRLVDKLKKPS